MGWLAHAVSNLTAIIVPTNCSLCGSAIFDATAPICDNCLENIVLWGSFRCHKCGRGLPLGSNAVCPECSSKRRAYVYAISAGPYKGRLRKMIIALKAVKATSLAIPIAELMAEAIRMDGRLAGDEIVVPVPVSADTLAGRGFNQAELIGDSLAKKLGLDFKPRALKKVRSTPDQASLSRLYRLRNLDGCFSAKESLVSGRSILLLDDVITTGATAQACATVLRAAGARKVVLATAAFTLSDDRTVPDGSATEILHSGAQR